MVLWAAVVLMASCQAGEELVGDSPLLQYAKLRLSDYAAGTGARMHSQEDAADRVILWDADHPISAGCI